MSAAALAGETLYGVQGKMTRRLLGVVMGTQGLAVFFGALVARALAAANGSHTSGSFLLVGSALAVLCILDAGLLRQPWGITVGWVLQVVTFACALVVPAMLVVALVFGVLWLTALVQGRAMDRHTKVVDERWHAAQQSAVQDLAVQDGTAPDGTAPDGTAQDGTAEDGTARDGTARDGTARDATVWDGTV